MNLKKLALAAFFLAVPSGLFAQSETGQISGTVFDPTGASVSNAHVLLKGTANGFARDAVTNDGGIYAFPSLQPGDYELSVSASGFSTTVQKTTITAGIRIGLDFRLEVGQMANVIEVTANGVQVNTETQTLSQTISTKQIVDLPTLTRNPYALVATVGTVSETTPDGRGAGFSINGQRAASTNLLLDGVANNDEFGAGIGQQTPLDSVQELNIQTNNFGAEAGRASGGVLNLVTKSGTNAYHGTAYEFNRVSRLGSNDFNNNANGVARSIYDRNQFGYSIGGHVPTFKDKLYFFQSTEFIRVRSNAPQIAFVPTPEFIAAAAPATQAFFSQFGSLASNATSLGTYNLTQLKALGYNPCTSATAACAALSTSTPLFNKVEYNIPADAGGGTPQNTYLQVARVDYNLSDKTQIYSRFANSKETDFNGSNSSSPYAGYNTGSLQNNLSALISATHSFTPNFVTQSKLDFNRFNNQQPLGTKFSPSLYYGGGSIGGTGTALPGYLPYAPGSAIPFGGPQNFLQAYQDFTLIKGRHQIRFGGSYTNLHDNRTFGAYAESVETIGRNAASAINNFLTGNLYTFQGAINPGGKFPCVGGVKTPECTITLPVGAPNFSRSNIYNEGAFYASDSWKFTPRLTLILGLRWEYYGTQHNKNGALDSNYYTPSSTNGLTGPALATVIAAGTVQIANKSKTGALWAPSLKNFAPRLGFAYDIFGDGKTSFRGGYGIGYERNFGNVTFNVIQNPPNYAVVSLVAGADLPTIPIYTDNSGPLGGSTGSKKLPAVSLRNINQAIKQAYAHQFSASLERQVAQGFVAAIDYSGAIGVNQYDIANYNPAGSGNLYLGIPCDPGSCGKRLNSQFTNINRRSSGGNSNYNAMNLRAEMNNFSRLGLTLRANYTWSHAIDDLSDTFSSAANQNVLGYTDIYQGSKIDKGDAYFDIRHRIVFAAVWDIPLASHANGLVKRVLGGWQFAPIFVARTGSPFTLYDSTNNQYVGNFRAAFIGGAPRKGNQPGNPAVADSPNTFGFLDTTKLSLDQTYVNALTGNSDFGPFPSNMSGRNAFRGFGNWNIDAGLYKTTTITERVSLQLRLEAYNMLNHANLAVNTGNNDLSGTSLITSSRGGNRNIQLAAKIIF